MNKFKKISFVVLTLVVLVSSFVISSFAMPSEEALVGSSLPAVSFCGVRANGEFYTGTDVMFPEIDNLIDGYGTYYAQISGDKTGSIRSRWTYSYDSFTDYTPFILAMITENTEYDIIIDFPFSSLGYSNGDIGWDFQTCYMVTNQFLYTATDQNEFNDHNFLITIELIDCRGFLSPDPNFTDGSYVLTLSLPYVSSLRQYLTDYTSISDFEYVSVSRMVISAFDNTYSTYGNLFLESIKTNRYSSAFENQRSFLNEGSRYIETVSNDAGFDDGYNSGYTVGFVDGKDEGFLEGAEEGYDEGYFWGYEAGNLDGYDEGFDIGYDMGYNAGFNEEGLFDFIIESCEAFLGAELYPGFSFGLLLTSILGVCLLIWLLKVFAGG